MSQMCLLSSVALRFDSILNEALCLAYLDLKLVAVNPTYVSTLLPQVTVRAVYDVASKALSV